MTEQAQEAGCVLCGGSLTYKGKPCPGANHVGARGPVAMPPEATQAAPTSPDGADPQGAPADPAAETTAATDDAAMTFAPCCNVGGRADVALINLAFNQGKSYKRIWDEACDRAVAQCLPPVSRTAIYLHRAHVPYTDAFATAMALEGAGSDALMALTQTTQAERIRQVVQVVSAGLWRGAETVTDLAERFGCTEDDVLRLHALAVRKVTAARGSVAAQLESSVAVASKLRDDAIDAGNRVKNVSTVALRRAQQASTREETDRHLAIAREATRMWGAHRSFALKAARHVDALTVLREDGPKISFRIDVEANPDFMAAFDMLVIVLDRRFPGASDVLRTAVTLFEEGGMEAVLEWLDSTDAIDVEGDVVPADGSTSAAVQEVPVEAIEAAPAVAEEQPGDDASAADDEAQDPDDEEADDDGDE